MTKKERKGQKERNKKERKGKTEETEKERARMTKKERKRRFGALAVRGRQRNHFEGRYA